MSGIDPITIYHFDPDKCEARAELVYPDSVLNEMARRVGDKLDAEILARLGYVKPVRCRDCEHYTPNDEFWLEPPQVPFPIIGATSDSCDFWAGTKCKVEPDGYCAWGVLREDE